jgi:hypothetical protein
MQSRVGRWVSFAVPILLFFATASDAVITTAEVGLPTGVCFGDFCGPRQLRVWTRFEGGESLGSESLSRVYAGVCFVNRDGDDPNKVHHVGFLFDEVSGRPHLLLRFSFFAETQPFDRLDPEQARFRFAGPLLPVSLLDGFAYAQLSGTQFFARYWFRRDPATSHLLLVSYLGYRTTIICDAAANVL